VITVVYLTASVECIELPVTLTTSVYSIALEALGY